MNTRSLLTFVVAVGYAPVAPAQAQPVDHYWVYVANESSDLVSLVRFGPDGLVEEQTVPVGIMPTDLDGAHGMTVSPSGQHWYISLAHGTPFGKVWKFTTGSNQLVDTASVGLFPATMATTPDGSLLFAVNFNLHGDPVPSTVSVLFTPTFQEIKRIETCVKPHGGIVNPAGTSYYSVCVGSDRLVEISTSDLEVSRQLDLTLGGPGVTSIATTSARCQPTWVAVTPDGATLFVPCNGRREMLEIAAATLTVRRRHPTGAGPYNAAVSPDGRTLVVTLKGEQAVTLLDIASGTQVKVPTSEPITHGVTISPDSRYAFVTNEAIGAVRGTVDVFDLETNALAGSVRVQHQPGGIAFWRQTDAGEKEIP